ncbi:hypothetical protein B0A52_04697 [Exophiala mesophila]|uniref:Uncharacterized protein n=1 Tax=Exophiala mesophila TaxID=212818 RepID=A0A438N921_EXOME|nr:hypothetical protein B0A52_04697 [Exophiala mesophila]
MKGPRALKVFQTSKNWLRNALAYHNVQILVVVFSLILWSILLAGCSTASRHMPSIYILSGSYPDHSEDVESQNSNGSSWENPELTTIIRNLSQHGRINVRAGFFATCVQLQSDLPRAQPWACGEADQLYQRIPAGSDPLNLIEYFSNFSSKVVFYGLM